MAADLFSGEWSRRIFRLLIFEIAASSVFRLVELHALESLPQSLARFDFARFEIGQHLAIAAAMTLTAAFAHTPLRRACWKVVWSIFVLWFVLAALGCMVFALLTGYEMDAFVYPHFYGPSVLWKMLWVIGPFPSLLFLAPYAGVLLFPLVLRRERRRETPPAAISLWRWTILLVLGVLCAGVPPIASSGADLRPLPVRLSLPPTAPEPLVLPDDEAPRFREPRISGPTRDSPFQHVAVVVLESVGASATTIYDPELPTTPYLAELAKRSLVVERAYAAAPHTSKALTAILCGIRPFPRMDIVEAEAGGLPIRCLPQILADAGLETVFFSAATRKFENRSTLIQEMGFEESFTVESLPKEDSERVYEKVNYFGYEDDVMLTPAQAWLDARREKRTFAVYLTNITHHDYRTPSHFATIDFETSKSRNAYLNTVRYLDRFIQRLMTRYEELGLSDETLFVILGDHGEGFDSHVVKTHDGVPYEDVLRIPWLFHGAEMEVGTVSRIVQQVDFVPTLLDVLGFDVVTEDYEGRSLLRPAPERPATSLCWYDYGCLAQTTEEEKRIYRFDRAPSERYDLLADPREQSDLGFSAEEASNWREEARRWYAEVDAAWSAHLKARDEKARDESN